MTEEKKQLCRDLYRLMAIQRTLIARKLRLMAELELTLRLQEWNEDLTWHWESAGDGLWYIVRLGGGCGPGKSRQFSTLEYREPYGVKRLPLELKKCLHRLQHARIVQEKQEKELKRDYPAEGEEEQ